MSLVLIDLSDVALINMFQTGFNNHFHILILDRGLLILSDLQVRCSGYEKANGTWSTRLFARFLSSCPFSRSVHQYE